MGKRKTEGHFFILLSCYIGVRKTTEEGLAHFLKFCPPTPTSPQIQANPHGKKTIFSPSFAGFYGGGKVLLILRRNPTRPLHKVPASKSRDKTLIWDTGVRIGTNLVHTVHRKRVLGCAWCNKTKVKKKRAKHAV